MKLKFKQDVTWEGKLLFCAGRVYDVSEENGWAWRWVKRGAEIVEDAIVEKEIQKVDAVQDTPESTPVKRTRKKKTPDLCKEL